MIQSIITGSGSYLPKKIVPNKSFEQATFYDENRELITKPTTEIIKKFEEITEISERRYLDNEELRSSDLATKVGKLAISEAGIDPEELDYIIVAHNFGDIDSKQRQVRIMPSVSALTKHKLKIKNPSCRTYDMIFGCPGWNEGLILADQLIKAGIAKKILIIGSETLSRTVDIYDRNSMIFSDGAAAVILEAREGNEKIGIINHYTRCDNREEIDFLNTDSSLNPNCKDERLNIRMKGRKIYEYALNNVPTSIKKVIDEAGFTITDINKLLIHQANAKMDHAMLQRVFKLYGIKSNDIPKHVAPMTIQKLGNSSVATIPTMYDLITKEKLSSHKFNSGDLIVFASVGAGMNINAILYRVP